MVLPPSRRISIFREIYQDWFRIDGSEVPSLPSGNRYATHRFDLGFLKIQRSYIDVQTRDKKAAGCLAVKVGKILLISDIFHKKNFYTELRTVAEQNGYAVIAMSSLVHFRSVLNGEPTPQQWRSVSTRVVRKFCRRENPTAQQIALLNSLIDIADPRCSILVQRARIRNAFYHSGEMTHCIYRDTDDVREKGALGKFFPDADTALSHFMALPDSSELRLLEFSNGTV